MNYLTPIPKQFSDQSGTPYSYGKVYVYVAGTSELANIYKEADSDVLAENPYTLDVAGSWQCFVPVSTPLDYIVTDTDNNTVFSFKNVSVPSDEGSGASVSKAYVDTQDRALGARISNLAADVDDEVARAEAAEKAAKTEVVEGENIRVEETIAPDGHSIFSVSSDGAPQEQANWTQQDPSEPDYIKNKPTNLSEFTDDITKQSLVESGVGIEKPVSSAAVNAGLSEKADKVQGATSGNLAALDANGNLTDSGKKAADFKTKQSAVTDPTADGTGLSFIDSVTQNANGDITPHKKTVQDGSTTHKGVVQLEDSFASTSTTTAATPNAVKSVYDIAATAVQGVKVNGTELSKDGNNVVDVPVPTASTSNPLKDGTASTGSSLQWARGDHRHPTDDSREAVANKVQSIDDSSTTEYPSSKAVADFVNSSVATNTATFLGNFSLADLSLTYPATEVQIAAALNSHTWPTGYPTNNDYVYVEIRNPQSTIDDKVQRYKYRDRLASWGYEYTLNNSSFTAEEKAAIDSGITSQDVTNLRADHTTLGNHVADTSNPHSVTKTQVGLGNVDNTSDADKPISTAQQTALNAKQDTISDLATIRNGASAGASALQPSGNGSNLSVTPDSTSTGTDIGNSTTLKVWAQKFKNLVGALKALAFKDKVSDSDISGTISDSHIASESTWNGKQNALPIKGTASTTYAIGISGNASTASTADKVKNGSNWTKTDNAAPQGLRVDRAYNNGWPYTYGNVVTVGGTGDGQLMLGWSGTTGGVAPIYYRNRRDQSGTTWSPWRTIAYQEDNGVSLSGQTLSVKINGTTQSLTNTDNTVKATAKTDNVNYKILATGSASPTSGGLTEAVYDIDITLNPSTNTIAANISGRAASATTASQVSATGSQKALAVSVDGISHTNGSKSTVIDGGQISTDTLSAETAVNSDGFWAKSSILVYGGNNPGSPTGNYILMSPNGIACYGGASFTGSLVGNASTATAVKDYGNTSKSIEIGWTGDSLTSANFLAAYAVVDGHTYIKDISPSNVTVGRATSDGSGNNIVNTYQKKVMISACARGYSPTINSGSTASVGNRPNNQLGIALLYPLSGTSYIEVSFNLSFTYPSAGGYGTYAVILKAGNSSSSMNQIGSVIKSTYQSGSSNYAEHVTVGGSVSSSPSYLVLEITNGYGSGVTFNLSTILIRITQNVTAAAQAT